MCIHQNDSISTKKWVVYAGLFFMTALTVLLPEWCGAYDLYVSSVKAQVYRMPDAGSEKLFELKMGTGLGGMKKAGYWHQVAYEGRVGWIYGFQVGYKPPVKKRDIYGSFKSLLEKYNMFTSRARRRSSAYSSVAAARGLKETRRHMNAQYRLDYNALEKMESIDITENQAMEFLKEGIRHDTHQ